MAQIDPDIQDIAAGVAFLVCKLPDDPSRLEKATNLIAEAMQGLREQGKS